MSRTPQQDKVVLFVLNNPGCSVHAASSALGGASQSAWHTIRRALKAGRLIDMGDEQRHRLYASQEEIANQKAQLDPTRFKTRKELNRQYGDRARRALIQLLKKHDIDFPALATLLRSRLGVLTTGAEIKATLSRGTFAASYFFMILNVLDVELVPKEELN